MNTLDTELVGMVKEADAIVLGVKEPPWYICWCSCAHLFLMISAISTVFRIDVEADALQRVIDIANDNNMAKYRIAVRLMMRLNPAQMFPFNGVIFYEAATARTRALGLAYIELCKTVKLGALDANEITSGNGIRILKNEFKRQLKHSNLKSERFRIL